MAGSGSVIIQRQGDAMPSGIDVNRMPKPIMEVGAWQKNMYQVKKRQAGDNCALQISPCFQLVTANTQLSYKK